MNEITRILNTIEAGDAQRAEQLLPLIYAELRKLAAQKLAREKPGQTLQATALVHEAYLRLVDGAPSREWDNRGHFFAAAAEAMRRILIENARRKASTKHGGQLHQVPLDEHIEDPSSCIEYPAPIDLLALDEALTKLERDDPQAAEVAKLRLFAGLTIDQAAASLGIHRATGFRHWAYARAFLQLELPEAADE
ncbi:MAG: ECF-type sigma factor [Pirellulales bacterium]